MYFFKCARNHVDPDRDKSVLQTPRKPIPRPMLAKENMLAPWEVVKEDLFYGEGVGY